VYRFGYEVVFRDCDMFGHVNNAVVCSLLETARFKFFKERFGEFAARYVIGHVEVDYLKPIRLGETIGIGLWVDRVGRTSWDFRYTVIRSSPEEELVKAGSRQVWYDFSRDAKAPLPPEVRAVLLAEHGG